MYYRLLQPLFYVETKYYVLTMCFLAVLVLEFDSAGVASPGGLGVPNVYFEIFHPRLVRFYVLWLVTSILNCRN